MLNLSTTYPGQVVTTDPNFPLGKPRNQVEDGDGTGTPWEEKLAQDLHGAFQALVSDAGVTVSGNPDNATASDVLNAVLAIAQRETLKQRVQEALANWGPQVRVQPDGPAIQLDSLAYCEQTNTLLAVDTGLGSSGIWCSDDGGNSWSGPLAGSSHGGTPNADGGAVGGKNGIFIIGYGTSGSTAQRIIRSADNGKTFAPVTLPASTTSQAYPFFDGVRFIVQSGSSVYYSSDDGATWNTSAALPGGYTLGGAGKCWAHNGSGQIVSSKANDGVDEGNEKILSSADGGQTWQTGTISGTGTPRVRGVAYLNGTWFAGGHDGSPIAPAFFSSTNRTTWTRLAAPVFQRFAHSGADISKCIGLFSAIGYLVGVFESGTRSACLAISRDGITWAPALSSVGHSESWPTGNAFVGHSRGATIISPYAEQALSGGSGTNYNRSFTRSTARLGLEI